MAPESNHNMDELLRAYAQRRQSEAGQPLELHPATRALLQGEVARTLAKAPPAPASTSWREGLRRFWPRLAWAGGLCTLLVAGVLVWQQNRPSHSLQLAQNNPAPQPALSSRGGLGSANAPVVAPAVPVLPAPSKAADPREFARTEATQPSANGGMANAKPNRPELAQASRDSDQVNAGSLRGFGGGATGAGTRSGTLERSELQKQLKRLPSQAKAADQPAPSQSGKALYAQKDAAPGAAALDKTGTLGRETAPAPSAQIARLTELSRSRAADQADPQTRLPAPSSASASNRGDAITAPHSGTALRQEALMPVERYAISSNQGKLAGDTQSLTVVITNRPPARALALREEARTANVTLERDSSATLETKPGATQPAQALNYYFVEDKSMVHYRYNPQSPPPAPVLRSFGWQEQGTNIQVVDADGSLYVGQWTVAPQGGETMAVEALEKKAGAKAEQALDTVSGLRKGSPQNERYFRISGTNRNLKQRVVFEGIMDGPAVPQPAVQARIRGKANIGTTNSFRVNVQSLTGATNGPAPPATPAAPARPR